MLCKSQLSHQPEQSSRRLGNKLQTSKGSHEKLPGAEGDDEGRRQVDEEAAEEVGQVRQEDPVEVSVEHDVGGLQVAVVQVLGRVDVSLVVPGKRLFS